MTDTGLTNRLRQHSRRSGLAVGLTMGTAIAICILAAAWIYGQLEPYAAEFAGYSVDEPTKVSEVAAVETDSDSGNDANQSDSGSAPSVTPANQTAGQPTVAPANLTPTSEIDFTATHTSNPDFTVNFRPGPSVLSGDPVTTLSPGTPLEYLDEQAQDEEGSIWLKMQTEDGTIGWLRDVDTQVIIS